MMDNGIEWMRNGIDGNWWGVDEAKRKETCMMAALGARRGDISQPRRRNTRLRASTALCALLASSIPTAMAQNCVSLSDSTQCPAFSAASVSTNAYLVGLFPFLSSVSDTKSFDTSLKAYISNGFSQLR